MSARPRVRRSRRRTAQTSTSADNGPLWPRPTAVSDPRDFAAKRSGTSPFFDLLRGWTEANRFDNVATSMFVEAASHPAGADVGPLLTEWLDETELPKLPDAR
jgi:hypothetical protein